MLWGMRLAGPKATIILAVVLFCGAILSGWRQYHVDDGTAACLSAAQDCGCGLRWPPGVQIPYQIDAKGLPGLSLADVVTTVQSGFDQWLSVSCSLCPANDPGSTPVACAPHPLAVDVTLVGLVAPGPVGGTCVRSNPKTGQCVKASSNGNNIEFFTDLQQWQDQSGQSSTVYGLTVITYSQVDGIIVDADILMNAASHTFCLSPCDGNALCNTITHEIGHFFGLDHSQVPGATLAPTASVGQTDKCVVHEDDQAGICHVYASTCAPTAVAKAPQGGGGCQAGFIPNVAITWPWLCVLAVLLWRRSVAQL